MTPKAVFGAVVLVIALAIGGWFWYGGIAGIINRNNTEQAIDNSSWKNYRSDEYGIEFKYPNDSVVVVQPSASKMFGTVFIIAQSTYDDLQKNSLIFQDNPLLGLIDSGEGVEIRWNRSLWIASHFQSNGFEKAFKILLNDGELATYTNGIPNQSSEFKTTVLALSKITNADVENEMYAYELQLKNTDTGTSSTRKGLIWKEQDFFYGELQFINKNISDSDLIKDTTIQIALSFEMF